jgi:transcriptional regulator with XRE-family HTH domain
MVGGDLVLMARRRAELSQRDLAERLGCRQATIARWERGDRQPSYADVNAAAEACGLRLDAHLTRDDRSWWPQIAAQLDLDPLERVRRLSASSHAADQLGLLAQLDLPAIVIGEIAGALHGWPLVLGRGAVELCVRPDPATTPVGPLEALRIQTDGAAEALVLVAVPPGTAGFADLARGAEALAVGGGEVRVAGLLDLLRIADASPDLAARRHARAYQAVLDVRRARREAAPQTDRTDGEKVEDWLSQQTPVAPA